MAKANAINVFARELNTVNLEKEGATKPGQTTSPPKWYLLPTGVWVNRISAVGVLVSAEDKSKGDDPFWTAKIVDGTGAIKFNAGKYHPETVALLADTEMASIVAIVGKPGLSEKYGTDINADTICVVPKAAQKRWQLNCSRDTLKRLKGLEDDTEESRQALEHYKDFSIDELKEAIKKVLVSLV